METTSQTPRTEDEILHGSDCYAFARQLETELNEARNQLYRICKDGFDMQDTIGMEPADDYVLRQVAAMLDAIKEAGNALIKASHVHRAITTYAQDQSDIDKEANRQHCEMLETSLAKLQPFIK